MTDQQTALERQRALYREKNAHLDQFLEPVEPYEFIGRSSRKVLLNEKVIMKMPKATLLH